MARRSPPRKVTYFEPVAAAPRPQHRHRIHLRGRPPLPLHDARRLRPARSRRGDPAGTRRMAPAYARALDEEELADWRAGRDAVYQLAALTVGARLAVADG